MSIRYTVSVAALLIGARNGPRLRGHGGREEVGRFRIPAFDAVEGRAAEGDAVVHQRRRSPSRAWRSTCCRKTIPTHNYESRDADQGLRGDHRHQGEPPDPRRRRGRPGGSDADADQPQSLRRLRQRLRPDRHAFAPAERRQPDRLDGRRRQGRHQSRRSTSTTSSASRSPPGRTASSGSCPTSSSPISTGSARTGSTARISRRSSRPSTATSSACRSTGRPMRTSPTSSPTT